VLCAYSLILITSNSWAEVKRIKAIAFNKGKVQKIFVAGGMSSLVTFNCDINEMITGNSEQVTLKPLITNKKQMIITLAQEASQPTNIFVKCGQKIDPYIFDVIPSRSNHQDYLKINLSYGEPTTENDEAEALNKVPKKKNPRSIEVKPLELKTDIKPETPIEKLKSKTRSVEVEPPREKLDDLLKEKGTIKDEDKIEEPKK
jgi:hypothetical protein